MQFQPNSRGSSVRIVTRLRAGFDSQRGFGLFLLAIGSRLPLEPTQPIEWVQRAVSLLVKWPGREADHSPPSSAEVKNAWSYTSTPHTSSWHGA
jgi:hypothetical protein